MGGLRLALRIERFPYHQPFRISGHVFTETALLVAEISDGTHTGRGEGAGVYYLGDDIDHMLAEATRVRHHIEGGATREDLQHLHQRLLVLVGDRHRIAPRRLDLGRPLRGQLIAQPLEPRPQGLALCRRQRHARMLRDRTIHRKTVRAGRDVLPSRPSRLPVSSS